MSYERRGKDTRHKYSNITCYRTHEGTRTVDSSSSRAAAEEGGDAVTHTRTIQAGGGTSPGYRQVLTFCLRYPVSGIHYTVSGPCIFDLMYHHIFVCIQYFGWFLWAIVRTMKLMSYGIYCRPLSIWCRNESYPRYGVLMFGSHNKEMSLPVRAVDYPFDDAKFPFAQSSAITVE